jgi:hypothetical protein
MPFMFTVTQRLIQGASFIRQMMQREPVITLDLRNADTRTILVFMYCLMVDGVDTAPAIYRYLAQRNCPLSRETIDFFLDQYDGDDPEHHLWKRHNFGDYFPMLEFLDQHTPRRSKFD